MDTEGFDLEILKGANKMLSLGNIVFVLEEVGFHPEDQRHVLFDDVRSFLLPRGYSVFGFYE
ncbi:MAG: FkbM family methyltransferase [Candidatus Omnitrophica bacterium]|nr:FkbM family methyltransferase [Candidatus Omnitrophota bacterium]